MVDTLYIYLDYPGKDRPLKRAVWAKALELESKIPNIGCQIQYDYTDSYQWIITFRMYLTTYGEKIADTILAIIMIDCRRYFCTLVRTGAKSKTTRWGVIFLRTMLCDVIIPLSRIQHNEVPQLAFKFAQWKTSALTCWKNWNRPTSHADLDYELSKKYKSIYLKNILN